MNYKNIVVVGYPKSGTTWASSLVAEILQCPLVGDWGFDHIYADYKEGIDRDSPYRCYKSHHTLETIHAASPKTIHKMIYIIRDPRDIVISGQHYFNFIPKSLHVLKNSKWGYLGKILRKLATKFVSQDHKKQQMVEAVLYGNKNVNEWLSSNWSEHYKSYHEAGICIIKYEDLLTIPLVSCKRICQELDMAIDESYLKQSIEKQSFVNKKKQVVEKDHVYLNKLIRKGESGYWKTDFKPKTLALFKKELSESEEYYHF